MNAALGNFKVLKKAKNEKRVVLMVDRGISFGGSLVVIARLAKSLDLDRYEPVIVSAMDWTTIRHHIPDSIKVYRVKEPYDYVMWARTVGKLRKIKPKLLFKPILYLFIILQLLANSTYFLRIARIIVAKNIALLHDNNSISAAAAAMLLRKPVVWHIHGHEYHKPKRFDFTSFIYNRATRYISISRYIAELAICTGVAEEKIEILHNPIDQDGELLTQNERMILKRQFGLAEGKVIVSIFGRLVSWKGQLELLKAVKLLHAKNLAFQLLIVGDDSEGYGVYLAELERFINENNLENDVVFSGYIMEVSPLYQISDIAVHASIEPEPFGLVITEATHNGCAVICSSHGAGPELVNDGYDGYIVDPFDTEELAAKLEILIIDPEKRAAMAARGKARVLKNLSPDAYAESVAAVYDAVLAKR